MMSSERFPIRVRLFAGARAAVGTDTLTLEVPCGGTVRVVREELARRFPGLRGLVASAGFAVGDVFVRDEMELAPDTELAWIPPVSGG
ncbi:MAG TPA: MoaD/ThiS family protein [Pirellulaceae bacterium]